MEDKEQEKLIRCEWRSFKKYCINKEVFPEFKTYEDFKEYYKKVWYYGGHQDFFKAIKIESELVMIDYGIADLIEKLNNSGYYTKFCCSGHKNDYNYKFGYIYFDFPRMDEEHKEKLIEIEKGDLTKYCKVHYSKLDKTTPRFEPLGEVKDEEKYFKNISNSILKSLSLL